MPPKSFLFVNKHQNSTSLTRNTKDEAQLATIVNKHVQKQRFQQDLGVRKVWYRPFVQSNNTTTVNSASSDPGLQETSSEQGEDKNVGLQDLCSSVSLKQPVLPQKPRITMNKSRSVKAGRAVPVRGDGTSSRHSTRKLPIATVASRPGDFNDPFNTTAVALTSTVMELVHIHGKWIEASSLTGYAVERGIQRVLSVILPHPVHARAWLAMAATQMTQFSNARFPADHRPELFSFEATKMIRDYLDSYSGLLDAHILMAAFRLAVAEWIRGNAQVARFHFSFVTQHWEKSLSKTGAGAHNIELITTEDVYLAVDVDEKPMFALIWEPLLPAEPSVAFDSSSEPNPASQIHAANQPLELSLDDEAGDKLVPLLKMTDQATC